MQITSMVKTWKKYYDPSLDLAASFRIEALWDGGLRCEAVHCVRSTKKAKQVDGNDIFKMP